MSSAPERQAIALHREERREHGRHKALWWAEIEVATGRFTCSVFDLSKGGAKLRVNRSIPERERLVLAIPPFGQFAGEVIWSGEALVGIAFATSEHARVEKMITSRLNEMPR
ncbi:MAG: PilZ domain-containing protein [Alphaproteobacteria bacterium]|nr:PilZ domain-containing protein [Alphaproteobacteria bacterium]